MSKYDPLRDYLNSVRPSRWEASFRDIEDILRATLPASARKYREWWVNEERGSHVQAHAWVKADWMVESVNLTKETVVFARAS